MERDQVKPTQRTLIRISTHTLTWSVTYCSGVILPLSAISTHTLTWSVTLADCQLWIVLSISTHTLTWSVTGMTLKKNATR